MYIFFFTEYIRIHVYVYVNIYIYIYIYIYVYIRICIYTIIIAVMYKHIVIMRVYTYIYIYTYMYIYIYVYVYAYCPNSVIADVPCHVTILPCALFLYSFRPECTGDYNEKRKSSRLVRRGERKLRWLCLSDFSSMALSSSGIAEGRTLERRRKEEPAGTEERRESVLACPLHVCQNPESSGT